MDTASREEFSRIDTWSSPTQASTSNTSTAWPGTVGQASHRDYSIHPCCTIYASDHLYWSSGYTTCSTSCTFSIIGLYHHFWLRVSWHGILIQNTQRHTRRSILENERHPRSAGSTFYYPWPAYCYPSSDTAASRPCSTLDWYSWAIRAESSSWGDDSTYGDHHSWCPTSGHSRDNPRAIMSTREPRSLIISLYCIYLVY